MGSYEIIVSKTAEKALLKIPKKDQVKVISAISELATHPFSARCKKVQGEENTFRIRIGDYRVIYEIEGRKLLVLVLKIGHRKEIYK